MAQGPNPPRRLRQPQVRPTFAHRPGSGAPDPMQRGELTQSFGGDTRQPLRTLPPTSAGTIAGTAAAPAAAPASPSSPSPGSGVQSIAFGVPAGFLINALLSASQGGPGASFNLTLSIGDGITKITSGALALAVPNVDYVVPGGAAGGDLALFYPNPEVTGIWGRPIASTPPSAGQVYAWDNIGLQWVPTTISGGGGSYPVGGPFYTAGFDILGNPAAYSNILIDANRIKIVFGSEARFAGDATYLNDWWFIRSGRDLVLRDNGADAVEFQESAGAFSGIKVHGDIQVTGDFVAASGNPGFTGTIVLAKLTLPGTNGSFTVENGIITSVIPAT